MDIRYILLAAATMRMLTILREIITPVTGKPDRKLTRSQLILFLLAWGTICGYGIWLLAYRTPQPLFSRPPNFIETHEEVANHNLAEKKVETRLTRAGCSKRRITRPQGARRLRRTLVVRRKETGD